MECLEGNSQRENSGWSELNLTSCLMGIEHNPELYGAPLFSNSSNAGFELETHKINDELVKFYSVRDMRVVTAILEHVQNGSVDPIMHG